MKKITRRETQNHIRREIKSITKSVKRENFNKAKREYKKNSNPQERKKIKESRFKKM